MASGATVMRCDTAATAGFSGRATPCAGARGAHARCVNAILGAPRRAGWRRQRLPSIVLNAASVETREAVPASEQASGPAGGQVSVDAASAPKAAATSKRVVLESAAELKSNWEHRAWVWGCTGVLGALAWQGLAQVEGVGDGAAVALAVVGAYLLADFGTGVAHWGLDNYGDANTPVFGRQIAAFQGHHVRPWTITEREFCNNVHQVFKPALPFGLAFLAVSAYLPAWLDVGLAWFIWLACMSQQFHAWSHMKRSEMHPVVLALQDAGLLISQRAHGAHHKAPFEGNYCIVSGLWNDALDGGGADDAFFRRLERLVHAATGVEPRCWREPDYTWVDHYFADGTNEG